MPGGVTSVAQVSTGIFHTCVIKADGTVICLGDNGSNQAAVPAGLDLSPDTPEALLQNLIDIVIEPKSSARDEQTPSRDAGDGDA